MLVVIMSTMELASWMGSNATRCWWGGDGGAMLVEVLGKVLVG